MLIACDSLAISFDVNHNRKMQKVALENWRNVKPITGIIIIHLENLGLLLNLHLAFITVQHRFVLNEHISRNKV